MIRTILFDLDGTLLDARGAGRRSMTRAFEEIVGRKPDERSLLDFAGRTDLAILRTFLSRAGIDPNDQALCREILDRYVAHIAEELARTEGCRLYPGVTDLLIRLRGEDEFLLGLLTGNCEGAARQKLLYFSIDRTFDFGAFGDESDDRNALLGIAKSHAERRAGHEIDRRSIAIVGDTPLDIECAHSGGASVLAVATGLFDQASLAKHRPDQLLPDLTDTEGVLRHLRRLTDPNRPGARATRHRAN